MELITSTYVGKEVDHIPDQVQGSVNGTASHKQVLGSQNKSSMWSGLVTKEMILARIILVQGTIEMESLITGWSLAWS